MLYLSSNSRPYISFAVRQATIFTLFPRLVHEQAINRIGKYLKHTHKKV